MYLLSHAMSLSKVFVNVVIFMMSKSNSWHDFKGTLSSYNLISFTSSYPLYTLL